MITEDKIYYILRHYLVMRGLPDCKWINIDIYYKVLYSIINGETDIYRLYGPGIIIQNKGKLNPEYILELNPIHLLLEGFNNINRGIDSNNLFIVKPQLSGSCTFYGIYYWIYYYFITKDPINGVIHFHKFVISMKIRYLNFLITYFNETKNLNLYDFNIYSTIISHVKVHSYII